MKRNLSIAALRPSAATNGGGNPPERLSVHSDSAAPALTRAEMTCCLRDVQSYWSTPHISSREIEELERQKLIQRAPTGLCAIRLTEEGARVKHGRA